MPPGTRSQPTRPHDSPPEDRPGTALNTETPPFSAHANGMRSSPSQAAFRPGQKWVRFSWRRCKAKHPLAHRMQSSDHCHLCSCSLQARKFDSSALPPFQSVLCAMSISLQLLCPRILSASTTPVPAHTVFSTCLQLAPARPVPSTRSSVHQAASPSDLFATLAVARMLPQALLLRCCYAMKTRQLTKCCRTKGVAQADQNLVIEGQLFGRAQ